MKMNKLILITLIAALFFSKMFSLTLKDCVDLARENNKELQKAREEVGKYKQEYNNVRGNLFPQISLSGGYNYKKSRLPDSAIPPSMSLLDEIYKDTDFADVPSNNDTLLIANDQLISGFLDGSMSSLIPEKEQSEYSLFGQIKLDQVLFMGGKLINGINIAGKLYHLQEKRFFLVEQEIIFNTIDLYFQTKLAEQVVEIQKDALGFANKYLKQVSDMFEQGLVSEYDLLRARLEVQKLQPEVLESKKNFELIKESFRNHLNLRDEEMELTENISLPEMKEIKLEGAISEALENRVEIELAEINVDVNKVSLRYEKGNFLPTVGLSAEYNYFGQDEKKIESNDFGNYYQVGVGFSMPLFTGLSNTAKRVKARHSLKQAELDHQDLQEKIELDVRNSYLQWQANLEKLQTQTDYVQLAEKGLQIAQARYENQVSNQLEVIDAQLQLKSARLSYLNAIYAVNISYTKLKKALGREL
ncbi:MAG: TolC family protein [Candidatus Cloacimonetes bacterium]|nr:TolC family protein [Candidatus Cloacimonadota bacterium]